MAFTYHGFWTAALEGTAARMNACLVGSGPVGDFPAAATYGGMLAWATDEQKLYYSTGAAWVACATLDFEDMNAGTQGDILYAGAAGAWAKLTAGTSGKYLKTLGAGANPLWDTVASGAWMKYRLASAYHFTLPLPNTSANEYVLAANRLYAVPFLCEAAHTVTKIGIRVTTGMAGAARLGIYADNGSIYPGALVSDCGTIDTTVAGLKEVSGLNISLSANTLYWLAFVANCAAKVRQCYPGWELIGSTDVDKGNSACEYYVAFAYAALPNPYSGGATKDLNAIDMGVYI